MASVYVIIDKKIRKTCPAYVISDQWSVRHIPAARSSSKPEQLTWARCRDHISPLARSRACRRSQWVRRPWSRRPRGRTASGRGRRPSVWRLTMPTWFSDRRRWGRWSACAASSSPSMPLHYLLGGLLVVASVGRRICGVFLWPLLWLWHGGILLHTKDPKIRIQAESITYTELRSFTKRRREMEVPAQFSPLKVQHFDQDICLKNEKFGSRWEVGAVLKLHHKETDISKNRAYDTS